MPPTTRPQMEEGPPTFPGGYDARKYANLSIDPAVKELFTYIGRYQPEKRKLASELKPFIPDYIAAAGDVDEFLKPPRPDGKFETLGLKVLDEPSASQSDPAILRKFLKANMKGTAALEDHEDGAIPHEDEDRDSKIDQWINSVDKLRESEVSGEVWNSTLYLTSDLCFGNSRKDGSPHVHFWGLTFLRLP
jgi:intraflagellar transport protein 46